MDEPPKHPFLDRPAYRQRRLRDAARMLPVAGAFLWLVPLLWQAGPEEPSGAARAAIYIFGVWLILIGAAFGIAAKMRDDPQTPPGET